MWVTRRRLGRRVSDMNLLEEPGRFYWKWFVVGGGLLALYGLERVVRTGAIF